MLTTGTQVGGYRIEGLLGKGGMGVVYEATQLALDRIVALKVLAAELTTDEAFRERFRREGRIQAGLNHAHIVPLYEAGELEGVGLFIAMRLVRGPNLKALLMAGELDPRRALRILEPVADALDAAHEARLVHRDVKPQNILVDRRDHPYLADFGLTRAPGDTALTRTGQFVGTLDYIAPELIRGEPPSPRSDLYSFAGVAYECLTGMVVFPRPSEPAVLYAHAFEPPPRASTLRPDLPVAVDDLLASALAKDPQERPESVLTFAAALRAAFDATTAPRRLPPPAAPAPEAATVARQAPAVATTAARAEPPRRSSGILSRAGRPWWLATLGTVLGITTGVLTVTDQFAGDDRPDTRRADTDRARRVASTAYAGGVGGVCEALNGSYRARRPDHRRLRRDVARARTLAGQRNAVLRDTRRTITRSSEVLEGLVALEPPASAREVHDRTVRAWERNLARLRRHAERVDGASTRRRLTAAIRALPRQRTLIQREGTLIRAGLKGLGTSRCDLDRPPDLPPVNLPALPSANTPDSAAPDASSPQSPDTSPPSTSPQPSTPPDSAAPQPDASAPQPGAPGPDVTSPAPDVTSPGDEIMP